MAALVALAFFAVGLGGGSHFDSDDALYTQMAREMVGSGDLVDNRWSGAVLFEKPPLLLWSLAASGAAFGWGEAAMRLPLALFAAMALAGLVVLARGLGCSDRRALLAAGLLGGSFLFVLMARRPMTDLPLLATSLCAAAAAVNRRWALAGALAGLALLAKGPAAAPLLAAPLAWVALRRAVSWRALGLAAVAGLAVAGPWYLAVTVRHGAEPWQTWFGYHVASRASGALVPGLDWAEALALLTEERLLLAGALAGLGLHAWRRTEPTLVGFALLWALCALAPVLASETRLAHYLLPVTPALALLAVAAVPERLMTHRLAPALATLAVVTALLAHPAKLSFWLGPDFGPAPATLGRAIARAAGPGDRVVAFNTTTASLTFYGGVPVWLQGDDARFMAIQRGIDMNRRAGLLRGPEDGPLPALSEGQRRFVVARVQPDLPRVLGALRGEAPTRPLWVLRAGELALANDAGLGEPVP